MFLLLQGLYYDGADSKGSATGVLLDGWEGCAVVLTRAAALEDLYGAVCQHKPPARAHHETEASIRTRLITYSDLSDRRAAFGQRWNRD